jgi:hypothetical protein
MRWIHRIVDLREAAVILFLPSEVKIEEACIHIAADLGLEGRQHLSGDGEGPRTLSAVHLSLFWEPERSSAARMSLTVTLAMLRGRAMERLGGP